MNIEGRTIRLRAVEPGDVDLMYEWENDCDIWPVSGTTEPFSRHQLERFVERHQDIVVTDAVETLCRYAHDTLRAHQLWCNVGADNEASLRLFRSAGFTEIGVKRDWLWRPNGYHDEVMLQKIFD